MVSKASAAPSRSRSSRRDAAVIDPAVLRVSLERLRPTQMAVGMRAVIYKRRKLERRIRKLKDIETALARRPIPTVRGPGGELFIIDNHHFGLALWQAEIATAFARIVADHSAMPPDHFWQRMEGDGWLYPFDEEGARVAPQRLPSWLHAMRHDPFRDLAWEVREAGGFRKAAEPYAEFRWAHYFRERIALGALREDPRAAFNEAMKLCRSRAAASLPGWQAYAA